MIRGIVEQLSVIVFYKTCAGSAGRHNIICSTEVFNKLGTNIPGFIPETSIKCGLSTTGLIGIVLYCTTDLLQHLYHVESSLRVKLVNKARNKNLYVHALSSLITKSNL
jgi:hypothetical protein